MDCERAIALIATQVDQEIAAADRELLQQHLAACPTCGTVAEAFQQQDRDLRRGFTPLRQQADAAGEQVIAQLRATPAPHPRVHFARGAAVALMGTAALLAVVWYLPQKPPQRDPVEPAPKVDVVTVPALSGYLAAKPRPAAPTVQSLAVGETLQTKAGERRRLALPDGTILFVNQGTSVTLDGDRRLNLTAGEVYVEVEPKPDLPFVVQTGSKEVRALGTKFSVRAEDAGPSVLVTQGTVQVSGLASLLHAGQQLAPGGRDASTAPRASHLLDWTRDLVAAAESPLVPKSEHCGGSLVALDPNGQEAKLSLRKYHVDVHIEDGFARTTIDQTYFNHLARRLEGTFYFPLPPDATLSRLAMYVVDGNETTLNEGGMCERNYARTVFESIVTKMQDPALLEWVDGSTFKMRVFPLEGRQEKRIVLSYTQKLDSLYGSTTYRFPAGHNLDRVRDWSLHVRVKGAARQAWKSATHALKAQTDGNDLILEDQAHAAKLDKDVQLSVADAATDTAGRFASAEHEGAKYLMVRYRPDLTTALREAQSPTRRRTDWLFLFESSGDRDPVLARVQIDVIRTLLINANHDDTFTILTAATRVGQVAAKQPATPENVKAALEALERVHLVGALDVGQAIAAAGPFLKEAKNPYLVHVGSGIPVLGERGEDVLAKRLREDVPYVGIGVGKRWSRNFMKLAAERTGGAFTQINPDDQVSWRAFELFSMLRTPRLLGVKVVDNAERVRFLSYTGAIAQGEEICAVARVEQGAWPRSITVSGTLHGKTFTQELPVAAVAAQAGYLPRTWAKLEIDRLLAENAEGNKPAIIELSKKSYVMTPFTSLLVLENDAMYAQYNVDRGRKDHWAQYACPPKMPIVYEPDPSQAPPVNAPQVKQAPAKPTAEQVLNTVLVRMPPRFFHYNNQPNYGNVLTAWQLLNHAYGVPVYGDAGKDFAYYSEQLLSLSKPRTAAPVFGNGKAQQRLAEFGNEEGDALVDVLSRPQSDSIKAGATHSKKRPGRGYYDPNRRLSLEGLLGDREVDFRGAPGAAVEDRLMKRTEMVKEMQEGGRPGNRGRRDMIDGDAFGRLDDFRIVLDIPVGDFAQGDSKGLRGKLRFRHGMQDIEVLDEAIIQWFAGQGRNHLNYRRPSFTGDERLFYDLVSYAPGMNTQRADIQAVLEAEAQPVAASQAGKIDVVARDLIDRARAAGWQKLTVTGPGGTETSIRFDGTGRYRYERFVSAGLREHVVCDGQSLWHLYPDLAVGARRSVSRFHRADFVERMPWVVQPAEDLARGADVRHVGGRTVRIVPLGAETAKDKDDKPLPYVVVQLVFVPSGRLAEYAVVKMPEDKVLFRETYDVNGTVRRFDAEGKERSVDKTLLEPTDAPDLVPATKGLVVLPLPYRDRSHVYAAHKINNFKDMSSDGALALIASDFATTNGWEILQVLADRYQGDMKSAGVYTLMAATGINVDDQTGSNKAGQHNCQSVLTHYGELPLGKYLAVMSHHDRRQQVTTVDIGAPADSLLRRLADFRNLTVPWRSGNYPSNDPKVREEQFKQVLDFVKKNRSSPLGWAMLDTMLNRGHYPEAVKSGLVEVLEQYHDEPALTYFARYELARALLHTDAAKARRLFVELYWKTFKDGGLPPIDHNFRQALNGESVNGGESNAWMELVRQTAAELLKAKHRGTVIGLAWQVQQLGDSLLADELLTRALEGVSDQDRLATTLAVIEHHWLAGRYARAEALLQPILDDPKTGDNPTLWRFAAAVAQQQQKVMRAVFCLERALTIEYRQLPEVINLQTLRQDFTTLLNAYGTAARLYKTLETAAPADFTARVVRLADRWRTLDPDGTHACQAAAVVLRAAGAPELAWDYLTTPIALRPNEGATYRSLAQNLHSQNEIDLADKAYVLAFETEPTNAELLWERGQMLQNAGKSAEARKVFGQLADGQWQPRFQWMAQQARWQLGRTAQR